MTSWPRYHCPWRLLEKKTTFPYVISLKGYLSSGHYADYRKSPKFDHHTKLRPLLHFFLKMWQMNYNYWESNIFIASQSKVFIKKVGGGGDFMGDFFILFVLYSTLLHMQPLRFHCADGCWGRTQDRCNWCTGSQTL